MPDERFLFDPRMMEWLQTVQGWWKSFGSDPLHDGQVNSPDQIIKGTEDEKKGTEDGKKELQPALVTIKGKYDVNWSLKSSLTASLLSVKLALAVTLNYSPFSKIQGKIKANLYAYKNEFCCNFMWKRDNKELFTRIIYNAFHADWKTLLKNHWKIIGVEKIRVHGLVLKENKSLSASNDREVTISTKDEMQTERKESITNKDSTYTYKKVTVEKKTDVTFDTSESTGDKASYVVSKKLSSVTHSLEEDITTFEENISKLNEKKAKVFNINGKIFTAQSKKTEIN